jgi:2-polyprenyl-3-methyl-5-hydroxy-6-metoxy-1,4-benzoquinol methylase
MSWFEELTKDLKGTTLCLGCGYGVLETLLALSNPQLFITASDLDEKRIAMAKKAVHDVPNINFQVLDVTKIVPSGNYDVIIFADLLHHLGKGEQEKLLDILLAMLKRGGTLIMKDVDTTPRWKYWWNYLHDSLMAGQPLNYKSSDYYSQYFRDKKNNVKMTKYARWWLPYNHYALIVKKGINE